MSTPNGRDLLRAIGVGNMQTNIVMPYLFVTPATTDPRMSQIILLVKYLQIMMISMGAEITPNGYLDNATAAAIQQIAGPGWEQRTWADVCQAVLQAKNGGTTWKQDPKQYITSNFGPSKMQLGDSPLDMLPDVPGGLLTYAIAGVVGYHLWKTRKR